MFIDYDDLNVIENQVEKPIVKKEPEKKKIVYKEFDSDELVHMDKTFAVDSDEFFEKGYYPYSLNFYDFEVFMGDWLVVIINPIEKVKRIIANDRDALLDYYKKHKNQIWVGYNSRNYDVYILKSILLEMNPKKVNDMIITHGMKGWQISDDFKDIQLLNFDVSARIVGLKQLEGFMGNDIRETTVPFDLDRPLTRPEMRETVTYCMHDVEQTIEVFKRTVVEYDSQIALCNTFELKINNISKSQAQLASVILNPNVEERFDEWDIQTPDTLILNKYKFVANWFLDKKNHNINSSLEFDLCGVPHVFAWGGAHGAIKKYKYVCNEDEVFVMADVTQLYPSLMEQYHLLSRNCDKRAYFILTDTIATSVRLKKEGKKKEREPYKRFNNIIYGAMGDKFNKLYDPRNRNLVCVYGQLLILDLIEKLEPIIELIQTNTDGILVKIKKSDYEKFAEKVHSWEKRTRLTMTFDNYVKVYQGDVNNYLICDSKGHFKSKGAYVKNLGELDYDLPIVNKAIVKFLTENIEPEETIKNCNKLKEFQKIVKINGDYLYGWHNGDYLSDKTFRVFASKSKDDTSILKCKYPIGTLLKGNGNESRKYCGEKFADTPDKCFIWNEDVNDVYVPDNLNKNWYIDLAKKRIEEKFGISMDKSLLF